MAVGTRNHRASAINLFLPFGRIYFRPDGNLDDEQDRKHMTFSYRSMFSMASYTFWTFITRVRNWSLFTRCRNWTVSTRERTYEL